MADTFISGRFVTGVMGYGKFGQKITGIWDIKTSPNGASVLVMTSRHHKGAFDVHLTV